MWGKSPNGSSFLLAHLESNKKECLSVDITINEENFIHLFVIGEGIIHLTGYSLKVNDFDNPEDDIFKALKPKAKLIEL